MTHRYGRLCFRLVVFEALASATCGNAAFADVEPAGSGALQEVVVTAQKREESLSKVPMSISAFTGDELAARGISSTEDLAKIVPGFQFTESLSGTPVYSLRGIGFNDTSASARPTVSVYVDEVPLPFSVETLGTGLDMERVEVLKGPQGTLFGQNATGGAINYIAAKPTQTYQAGTDFSIGNFNASQAGGFVSGPLTDTLSARFAVEHYGSDGWQESTSRHDTLGVKDLTVARFLLDWTPADALRLATNLNGWYNRSESQAAQFLEFSATTPPFTPLLPAGIVNAAPAPQNDRAADWNPGLNYHHDDRFLQAAVRADYDVTPMVKLTSISTFMDYRENYLQDTDGTYYLLFSVGPSSSLKTVSQEFRAAANLGDKLHLLGGVNYEHDRIFENFDERLMSTASYGFSGFPGGPKQFTHVHVPIHEKADTYAGFANADYDVLDNITVHGGVRYTHAKTDFNACTYDGGDGAAAQGFSIVESAVRGAFGLPPVVIPPGGCQTVDAATLAPGVSYDVLTEHNVSWRTGLDWKLTADTLVYGNISKGYKAGSFPILGATSSVQYEPATQESVLAYEVGLKTLQFNRTLQLTGAVFYYDYSDKQVLGVFNDAVFGGLKREVNVPKSQEKGAELQATWLPLQHLTLTFGVTYLDSRIKGDFVTQDLKNRPVDVGGEAFPFTPRWQAIADAEFHWNLTDGVVGLVGSSASTQSSTNAELGDLPETNISSYSLIDLRAGVRAEDGHWSVTAWGRNVADRYYWTNATSYMDTFVRFTGMPRTYGLSFSYRFR